MGGNIRKIWYVSDTLPSTRPPTRPSAPRSGCLPAARGRSLSLGLATAILAGAVGCRSAQPAPAIDPSRVGIGLGPERTVPTSTTLPMAGSRCVGNACTCREPGANEVETVPPAEGMKRLELRMSAEGGVAAVELSGLGRLAVAGAPEVCAYVDVPAGSVHQVEYTAKETSKGLGVAPRLQIAEYGPKGPYWYDLMSIVCDG